MILSSCMSYIPLYSLTNAVQDAKAKNILQYTQKESPSCVLVVVLLGLGALTPDAVMCFLRFSKYLAGWCVSVVVRISNLLYPV